MLIKANSFGPILFAIYFCVSANTAIINAQPCPGGGIFFGPSVTVEGASCPQLYSRTNETGLIRWNGGGRTEVWLDVQISSGENGNIGTYSVGVAVSGLFTGMPVMITTIPLQSGLLLNCDENPVSGISGRGDVDIDPQAEGGAYLDCVGRGGVSFDPPITSSPNDVEITIRAALLQCTGTCFGNK